MDQVKVEPIKERRALLFSFSLSLVIGNLVSAGGIRLLNIFTLARPQLAIIIHNILYNIQYIIKYTYYTTVKKRLERVLEGILDPNPNQIKPITKYKARKNEVFLVYS